MTHYYADPLTATDATALRDHAPSPDGTIMMAAAIAAARVARRYAQRAFMMLSDPGSADLPPIGSLSCPPETPVCLGSISDRPS